MVVFWYYKQSFYNRCSSSICSTRLTPYSCWMCIQNVMYLHRRYRRISVHLLLLINLSALSTIVNRVTWWCSQMTDWGNCFHQFQIPIVSIESNRRPPLWSRALLCVFWLIPRLVRCSKFQKKCHIILKKKLNYFFFII